MKNFNESLEVLKKYNKEPFHKTLNAMQDMEDEIMAFLPPLG